MSATERYRYYRSYNSTTHKYDLIWLFTKADAIIQDKSHIMLNSNVINWGDNGSAVTLTPLSVLNDTTASTPGFVDNGDLVIPKGTLIENGKHLYMCNVAFTISNIVSANYNSTKFSAISSNLIDLGVYNNDDKVNLDLLFDNPTQSTRKIKNSLLPDTIFGQVSYGGTLGTAGLMGINISTASPMLIEKLKRSSLKKSSSTFTLASDGRYANISSLSSFSIFPLELTDINRESMYIDGQTYDVWSEGTTLFAEELTNVYFICTENGTYTYTSQDESISRTITFEKGDWILCDGQHFDVIDNTDAVRTVNGHIGDVKTFLNCGDSTTLTATKAELIGLQDGDLFKYGNGLYLRNSNTLGSSITESSASFIMGVLVDGHNYQTFSTLVAKSNIATNTSSGLLYLFTSEVEYQSNSSNYNQVATKGTYNIPYLNQKFHDLESKSLGGVLINNGSYADNVDLASKLIVITNPGGNEIITAKIPENMVYLSKSDDDLEISNGSIPDAQ